MKSLNRKNNRPKTGWELNELNKRKAKCLTQGIDLNDFKIISALVGTHLSFHSINWQHFDFVSLLGESKNPINNKTAYHFTGSRNERITVLVCDKISNY